MRAAAVVLLGVTMAFAPAPATAHDVHLTYGRLVVEGRTLTLRLRLFRDDLTQALGRSGGAPVALATGARGDSLFTRYVNDRLHVVADGHRLTGVVVASGADELMWWYEVRFDARAAVRTLRLRNGVLFDLFADQRNIVKVVQFPSERQYVLSFATRDTEPQTIAFPDR